MHRIRCIVCLFVAAIVGISSEPLRVPNPHQYYQHLQVIYLNTHVHTDHSDATGPGSSLTSVIAKNCQQFDGLFLTDHGEHLTQQEWHEQATATYAGKLIVPGIEVTGTGAKATNNKNPAHQPGWGHVIAIGTTTFTGTRSWGNGSPPTICKTFAEFKAWLALQASGMAVFAHPSLYMVEQSFDGFAAPANEREVEQFVGCELCSHSVRYTGLGDGTTLRSSNEACYRQLLRQGWRIGAYMGGDEHTPPYGDSTTVTGFYLRERTIGGVVEAMGSRRTFATEEPRAAIQLVATGETTAIMGEDLTVADECVIHARCTTQSSTVERITLVAISRRGAFYDVIQKSQQLHRQDEHWGIIISREDLESRSICAAYTKAHLANGRDVVSSPIWITTRP